MSTPVWGRRTRSAGDECGRGLGLRLKEVGKILGEDHGDARQVAEGGDDAAGFKLGEEAGGEAGVTAEFHQAHGLLEPEALDAFADAFFGDEGFGGFRVHLGLLNLFAFDHCQFSHGELLSMQI